MAPGPSRGVWRSIVESIRDWTSSLLGDEPKSSADVVSPPSEELPFAKAPTPSEFQALSERNALLDVPLVHDDEPPAHWAEKVRHAAPQLLRPKAPPTAANVMSFPKVEASWP